MFAKAIEGQDISSFFNFGGSTGDAPAQVPKQADKVVKTEDVKKSNKEKAPVKEEKPVE